MITEEPQKRRTVVRGNDGRMWQKAIKWWYSQDGERWTWGPLLRFYGPLTQDNETDRYESNRELLWRAQR